MIDKCRGLIELLHSERPDLDSEIQKHKWLMSEKVGYDVGKDKATLDFIHNYLDSWASGYRDCFCSNCCKYKEECKR